MRREALGEIEGACGSIGRRHAEPDLADTAHLVGAPDCHPQEGAAEAAPPELGQDEHAPDGRLVLVLQAVLTKHPRDTDQPVVWLEGAENNVLRAVAGNGEP